MVIGNPPYIRIQNMKEYAPDEVEFYKEKYKSASKGNYDIYVVFVEKGLEFLNKDGKLGFIVPHKFFNSKYGEPLRKIISEGKHIYHIVQFGDLQIFEGATTYTCMLFLCNTPKKEFKFLQVSDLSGWRFKLIAKKGIVSNIEISSMEWNFVIGKEAKIFKKLQQN